MRNPLRYGNKAALIVGVVLMLVDNVPLAHEFGAWNIGALLCVWYSATAIHEDARIGRRIKYGLYVYLVVVLALGGLVTVVVPLALFWAMLGIWLGRAQQRRTQAIAPPVGRSC